MSYEKVLADLKKDAATLPRHLNYAVTQYGVTEKAGSGNNPVILQWARDISIGHLYKDDSMPWCGLFVAKCVHAAGRQTLSGWNNLRALKWVSWGIPVSVAMRGDILVFSRSGGGHVGFYVGETHNTYIVYGGNQGDKVCIIELPKSRCVGISRPAYNNQPVGVTAMVYASFGASNSSLS
jgi:uncharacterized protein (TIGR02594 family)